MRTKESLRGLYVITDDTLTPKESLFQSVELALKGGAKIVQLRDKHSNDEEIVETIKALQELCHAYDALFVLNDRVELAIALECSGLHIGKSDHHRFAQIRQNFKGILGVSCYGDVNLAQEMEAMRADYVAFGSVFASPTKPHADIIDLALLRHAKSLLNVPICVIGGITSDNAPDLVAHYKPDMVAVISDIWNNEIQKQAQLYTNLYQGEQMRLRIALEWFINPDHLPFMAGIVSGAYEKAGIKVELIEPKEHYDGFEDLKEGNIDIHINEPLHLFEHHFESLRSLGCFFETQGGVMMCASSIPKLHTNQPIRITTPAANEVTNKIGFEILKRYANQEGFALDKANVEFVQTDFYHIKNMQEGDFDGAWLCFYNFEVIEAQHKNFEHLFISQEVSPYPNFSALEIMTTQEVMHTKQEAIAAFVETTAKMVNFLQKDPTMAQQIYYDYTGQTPDDLMDKIIIDTLPRFETSIEASPTRWQKLYAFLEELELVKLSSESYRRIWLKKKE